jgi:hypothetical protein
MWAQGGLSAPGSQKSGSGSQETGMHLPKADRRNIRPVGRRAGALAAPDSRPHRLQPRTGSRAREGPRGSRALAARHPASGGS